MCIHVRQHYGAFLASEVSRCDCKSGSSFTPCVCELYFHTHSGKGTGIPAGKTISANGFYDMVAYLQDLTFTKAPGYSFLLTLNPARLSHPVPIPSRCTSGVYKRVLKTNCRLPRIIWELLSRMEHASTQGRSLHSSLREYKAQRIQSQSEIASEEMGKVEGRSKKAGGLE